MISNSFQLVEELVEPLGDASLVLVGAVAGEEHIDRAGVVEIPRGAHAGVDAEDVHQARNVVAELQLLRAVVEIVALGDHRQRVAAHLADVFFGDWSCYHLL